jgi:hypothetical protein
MSARSLGGALRFYALLVQAVTQSQMTASRG